MKKITLKQATLFVPLVVSSFLFGLSLKIPGDPGDILGLIFSPQFLTFLLGILITITLLATTGGLLAIFISDKPLLAGAFVLSTVGFAVGLTPQPSPASLGLAILFALALLLHNRATQRQLQDYARFAVFKIFTQTSRSLVTPFSLVAALSIYLASQQALVTFEMPQDKLNQALTPITQFLEQNLGKQLEGIIGTQNPEELLKFLKTEGQETLEEGSLRQQLLPIDRATLEKIPTDPQEITASITQELSQQIAGALEPYLKLLPFILAISIFLAPQPLRGIVGYLATALIALTLAVLKSLKFVKIEKRTKEADWPILS